MNRKDIEVTADEKERALRYRGAVTEIESWFPILNWEQSPNFGDVYTIVEQDEFDSNYYLSPELKKFAKDLLFTLTGGAHAITNIRIIGSPGCGKTSFLHYLSRKALNNKNFLNRFCFYICRGNRAAFDTYEEVKNNILIDIVDAWKSYFEACDISGDYTFLNPKDKYTPAVADSIIRYYKKNKQKFNKILIFIVDQSDLLEPVQAAYLTKTIMTYLGDATIKKWISLRENTYYSYDKNVKEFISGFFYDPRRFPLVSLHEIIQHRVANTIKSAKAKNPYSRYLCDTIVDAVYCGNYRQSLSTLRSLLIYSDVGEIAKSASEEFIQEYIQRNAIKALMVLQELPNLYSPVFRVGKFPIVIDTLLASIHSTNKDILYSMVSNAIEKRLKRKKDINQQDAFKLRQDLLENAIELLVGLNLIEYQSKDSISVTPKGKIMAKYVQRKVYKDVCKRMLIVGDEIDGGSIEFWNLADTYVNHENIFNNFMIWKFGN